jgi:predicted small secreted protein
MKILNLKGCLLSCISMALVVGALSGCHASKGLGRDIKESTTTAGHKLQEADAWLQEHAW